MSFCHNKQYEREFATLMCLEGHHCERVAGSGSAKEAVCDCVLFRDGKSFLVEVKSTRDKTFYVRTHIRIQLELMMQTAKKQGINALLAVKFKYRGWKQLDITEQIPEVIRC
jgi:Holliday junction resolvase